MKRILATTLVIWYTLLSVGITVHVHYCCGQLAGLEINAAQLQEEDCCAHSHERCTLEHGCCDSDDVYLALEEAHQRPFSEINFPKAISRISIDYLPFEENHSQQQAISASAHPPNGPPLYQLHQQHLFYG